MLVSVRGPVIRSQANRCVKAPSANAPSPLQAELDLNGRLVRVRLESAFWVDSLAAACACRSRLFRHYLNFSWLNGPMDGAALCGLRHLARRWRGVSLDAAFRTKEAPPSHPVGRHLGAGESGVVYF